MINHIAISDWHIIIAGTLRDNIMSNLRLFISNKGVSLKQTVSSLQENTDIL